jgi:hypothetical protein
LTSAIEVAKKDKTVEWLLDNKNPAIRYWTLKDILGEPEMEYEVVQAREQIASWTPVEQYLNEQHSDGYWAQERMSTGRSGPRLFGRSYCWQSSAFQARIHRSRKAANIS